MARPVMARNSRCVYAYLQSSSSVNSYALGTRFNDAASMVGWPSTSTNVSGVPLPNAWLRLKRQGDIFKAFRSTNGMDWLMMGQLTNALPETLLVGPASSASVNSANQSTTVWLRDYQDFGPSIQTQPQSQTVTSGVAVVFGVTLRGQAPLGCQWFFNGLALAHETNHLLTLSSVMVSNAGDYSVFITNSYGAITSQLATLVVDGVGIGGFEGDIMPRPNGNNAVTISDWVEVGLLVVGLDTVLNSSEFARADCAPRMVGTNLALGDGRMTVADWTQAGRYAAGLDTNTPAGGPRVPTSSLLLRALQPSLDGSGRTLQLGEVRVWQNGEIELPVQLSSKGDENALGFSLTFDPARLSYRGATTGNGANGAIMQVNAQAASIGLVGLALANSTGQHFSIGAQEVARLRFQALSATGTVPLSFSDKPVFREIVNVTAAPLSMAYLNGTVAVIASPKFVAAEAPSSGGIRLTLSGASGETCEIQASSDLEHWTAISTNLLGNEPIEFLDPDAPSHKQRFYRLVPKP